MTTLVTIARGGDYRPAYSFIVTDLEEYDNKKKLYTSSWFDWYMVLIPSDKSFANNADFSKNEKLSKNFKILLKCSFQFKFRQFFKRNLSKSFQGKCVDHLSSFKCFIWPYLFEFLRFEMGKNRRFHSWINKSWFLTEKNYWSNIFRPQYLQMYFFEVIRPWNGEKWIFQTRKLKPRNWVW